jgi:isoleucyl-tRNA synthetase
VSKKGSDAWWYMTTEELLPDEYRDKASEYRKGTDTMDVWFDTGRILSFTVTLITNFFIESCIGDGFHRTYQCSA